MKQETKHTPGPWSVAGSDGSNGWCENRHIFASADRNSGGTGCVASVHNSEANARLIAAAPELLEALQGILAVANVRIDDPRCDAFDFARSIVSKATSR